MKNTLRNYLSFSIIAAVIILLDQLSKNWVRETLAVGETWLSLAWMEPYFRIVHWYNTGVAFGMLQGMNVLFSVLAAIVAAAILYYYPRVPSHDHILRTAMAMQFAGAVGNLIDRVTIGHVTDFISVGSFPVFNVADSSITIGVAVLVLGMWLQETKHSQPVADESNPPEPGEQNPGFEDDH